MMGFREAFISSLKSENKFRCVEMVIDELSKGTIGISELYTNVLSPSLNSISCDIEDKKLCIWKEHIQTSIVRSVIENSYMFMVKEKEKNSVVDNGMTVVIVCPDGEYHEIGARMAADFFELNGFRTIFVGSSTPAFELIDVLNSLKPEYIALSITNRYNMVSAKRTIEIIRSRSDYDVGILVGGYAFNNKEELYKEIGADRLLQTYDDVVSFAEEVGK